MSGNLNQEIFSTLEIDTIGEIMNISMGSAATAASTLLDNKVTITTPVVKVVSKEEFQISQLLPAIAVDIKYVEGISGSNILILRQEDVRTILSQMMMTEIPEDFVIDEMAESAICELMNQMMGSSATVLSCFLGRTINISTPSTVPIDRLDEFKQEHFGDNDAILTITFSLSIKDLMESTFVCAMQIELAKEIIGVSLNFDSEVIPEEPEPEPLPEPPVVMPAAPQAPQQQPPMQQQQPIIQPPVQQQQPPVQQQQPPMQQQPMPQPPPMQQPAMPPQQPYMDYSQQYGGHQPPMPPNYGYNPYAQPYPQMPPQGYGYAPPPPHDPIMVKDYNFGDFAQGTTLDKEQMSNLDLVMNVPVQVTVELGRTKRKIKEILEFGQGSIVELDKQAGSQVDVIVNGQLIARGDVVVVDDNFSIRITEILKSRDSLTMF